MDVGEAEVAPAVAVGSFLVVEAHQVQDRGVQVVHMHPVLDRLKPNSSVAPGRSPPCTPPPASTS